MGTTWSVVVSQSAGQDQERLREAIEAELVAVNDLASTWQSDSQLSIFNAETVGDWVSVSPELFALFTLARDVNAASGGAFDVTVGPLVNLWGFGPEKLPDRVPSDDEIANAQALAGPRVWELHREPMRARKLSEGVYVDLSALAKGYGVDRIAELLRRRGVSEFLAEIGGELFASGKSPRGDAWKVGIERPDASDRGVYAAVSLVEGGLATSGDYRNFFEQDGVRYSHTIDPRTGKPTSHRLASVSVYAPDSVSADAWATALMVLGEEAGFEVAEKRNLAAFFLYVDEDGFSAKVTEAFKPLLEEG